MPEERYFGCKTPSSCIGSRRCPRGLVGWPDRSGSPCCLVCVPAWGTHWRPSPSLSPSGEGRCSIWSPASLSRLRMGWEIAVRVTLMGQYRTCQASRAAAYLSVTDRPGLHLPSSVCWRSGSWSLPWCRDGRRCGWQSWWWLRSPDSRYRFYHWEKYSCQFVSKYLTDWLTCPALIYPSPGSVWTWSTRSRSL